MLNQFLNSQLEQDNNNTGNKNNNIINENFIAQDHCTCNILL